ncbi:Arc family DNA-binding protein [Burkholderia gladioli]|uniref:Arc family DNA-binding protein n=1 Tax=Burkholderia gladioli TaxID=28095 RepID=UPI000F80B135|nr:Arc family DNA-binding protein [Burkholderia gladioli]
MSKKVPVSTIVPFGLRLQPELKSRLEAEAAANNRSLNAEIAERLEASLAQPAGTAESDAIAKLLIENKTLRQEMMKLRTSMRIRPGLKSSPWQAASWDSGKDQPERVRVIDATGPKLLHQMVELAEENEKLRQEVGEVLEIVKNAMTPEELRRRYGGSSASGSEHANQNPPSKNPPKQTPPPKNRAKKPTDPSS